MPTTLTKGDFTIQMEFVDNPRLARRFVHGSRAIVPSAQGTALGAIVRKFLITEAKVDLDLDANSDLVNKTAWLAHTTWHSSLQDIDRYDAAGVMTVEENVMTMDLLLVQINLTGSSPAMCHRFACKAAAFATTASCDKSYSDGEMPITLRLVVEQDLPTKMFVAKF